ncbi:ABC transporter substrate-binding protein [Nocardia arthritidis]|uniref:ABC transporter substrate-binding protein n=1 Tax=Nocardia arthritidis TaxID=228602 RepID=A0A6G9YLR7_9NOCA|nr:iron-siderophore ABC transporter substrate-binding protein [Nocardia arthritidis]QIS14080.1 ABC transporter substrate-binding protein [Nocardia arthritidis]
MARLRLGRRRFGLALAGVLTAGLLTGCAEAQQNPSGPSVTVEHAMGRTVVPAHPARVVVLDTPELDAVTALGVRPVGAAVVDPGTLDLPGYLRAELQGTERVGSMDEPSLEKIATLKPDLILSSKTRHEQIYPQLARIAPTVFAETPGYSWKDNFRLYAKALGKDSEADALLATYQRRATGLGSAFAAANGGVPPTVSVVRFIDGPTRLYQKKTFSGVVLSDLGVRRPPAEDVDDFSLDVGPELADKADADYVFTMSYGDPAKSQQQSFTASPLWHTLNAVRTHRVFPVSDEVWMLGIGVQGANLVLDDIARAAAVDPMRGPIR